MESDKSVMIDDYVLKRELGNGANARVYLGYHSAKSSEAFAIKLINGESSNSEEVNAESIIMEAKTLQNLNHPNIIKVYELKADGKINNRGTVYDGNTLYCVMQLAEKGVMLDYLMNGGAMSENVARHYFRQLVEGMIFIHNKGVVHRDLKPDNLLLGSQYELLIADFGHCAEDDGKKKITKLATRLGTPIYNAPEISSTKSTEYDGKAVDSFMVGVVLFVMLTANTPFRDGASINDPFYKFFFNGTPQGFWSLHQSRLKNINFSEDLKDLLNGLFAVDGKQRPDLTKVLEHKWFSGPVASEEEVKKDMRKRFEIQEDKQKIEAEKAAARKARAGKRTGGSAAYGGEGHRAVTVDRDGILEHLNDDSEDIKRAVNAIVFDKHVPEYTNEGSSFFYSYHSALSPEELLKAATVVANNMTENADVVINVDKYEVD